MEYENVTQSVLFYIESIVQNAEQNFLSYTSIFRKQFYSVLSDLKIIGHGNPDSNLESHCTHRRILLLPVSEV
jgi:hypothetical protein